MKTRGVAEKPWWAFGARAGSIPARGPALKHPLEGKPLNGREQVYNMNVRDIIKQYLRCHGFDGLVNTEVPCGCTLSDMCPCEGDGLECLPAYKHYDPRPGKEHMWGMFLHKHPPTVEQFERLEREM